MDNPVPLGAILRQRYVIQEILGQGGFGRTYRAIDRERFDEPCVLKEFIVPYQDPALVEKSQALFQREASILHQLDHPQVPRFWAAFEDEQRLFLVQSYIEGQTYRQLLSDRKQRQQTFSEAEVLHLLKNLLPVLAYLHDRDIIHRDISPENIILKPSEATRMTKAPPPLLGTPVLIDFGAVKEATSHWPLVSGITRVGKVGYAPPEQLQTGRVSPSSDLYALAATSLTLLTGKEPRALLDSQSLTWQWHSYANLSGTLAAVLQRMLAVYPGDRYPSAQEVLADLQPLLSAPPSETLLQPQTTRAVQGFPTPQPLTVPEPASSSASGAAVPPSKSAPTRALWKFGVAASLLAALGVSLPIAGRLWSAPSNANRDVWVMGARMSESEATRIIESQKSNAAIQDRSNLVLPAPIVGKQPKAIQIPPGKVATRLQGTLEPGQMQPYRLRASQGQIMTASVEGETVKMTLLRSNQDGIDTSAYQTRSWTGQLPADDEYLIQVSGSGSYSLDVAITPSAPSAQEDTRRVSFTRGTSGTTVTGRLEPQQLRRYLLKAKSGQILSMRVLQGDIRFSAIAPNGQRIGGSSTASKSWQGRIPTEGDYVIEVATDQPGEYALTFEVF